MKKLFKMKTILIKVLMVVGVLVAQNVYSQNFMGTKMRSILVPSDPKKIIVVETSSDIIPPPTYMAPPPLTDGINNTDQGPASFPNNEDEGKGCLPINFDPASERFDIYYDMTSEMLNELINQDSNILIRLNRFDENGNLNPNPSDGSVPKMYLVIYFANNLENIFSISPELTFSERGMFYESKTSYSFTSWQNIDLECIQGQEFEELELTATLVKKEDVGFSPYFDLLSSPVPYHYFIHDMQEFSHIVPVLAKFCCPDNYEQGGLGLNSNYPYFGEKDDRSKPFENLVYPNPASSKLFISKLNLKSSKLMRIVNINGEVLKSFDSNFRNDFIDISTLTPGVYYLQLISESEKDVNIFKFIKQ